MSDKRYFVDERSGCIAVRDITETNPDYKGLHPDTPGVIQYWSGEQTYVTCPTCNHARPMGWEVSDAVRQIAHSLCDKLNNQT